MAVAGEYRHAAITREDLVEEGRGWGLAGATTILDETLATVRELVTTDRPDERAHKGLDDGIRRFTGNLMAGRPVGGV